MCIFFSGGEDLVDVSNGVSEVTTLGRLKFKSLSQLNNMTLPCIINLDHKNRQFVFVCLCSSSSELVALISHWDTRQKTDTVVTDTTDSVATDTTEDVVMTTFKKQRTTQRSNSDGSMRRRSVRLEARRIASEIPSLGEQSKESELIVPLEGTEMFMSELRGASNWRKLGKLPEVSLIAMCSILILYIRA